MLLFVTGNAAVKNGASNVDPDPVRVGAWPPGTVLTADRPPEQRANTLRKVTDLLLANGLNYTEEQILLFDDVIGRLAATIEWTLIWGSKKGLIESSGVLQTPFLFRGGTNRTNYLQGIFFGGFEAGY